MSKKLMKLTLVALLVVSVIACASVVMAGGESISFNDVGVNKVTEGAKDESGAASSVNRMIGAILTVTQIVGVGVAVIMLVVLAIKYISAAPGDKADIKKHAVVYVVGAVVLFAASGILQIIKKFSTNIH